jgi:hypothetical protein
MSMAHPFPVGQVAAPAPGVSGQLKCIQWGAEFAAGVKVVLIIVRIITTGKTRQAEESVFSLFAGARAGGHNGGF